VGAFGLVEGNVTLLKSVLCAIIVSHYKVRPEENKKTAAPNKTQPAQGAPALINARRSRLKITHLIGSARLERRPQQQETADELTRAQTKKNTIALFGKCSV
jgi:hypothetical protein